MGGDIGETVIRGMQIFDKIAREQGGARETNKGRVVDCCSTFGTEIKHRTCDLQFI